MAEVKVVPVPSPDKQVVLTLTPDEFVRTRTAVYLMANPRITESLHGYTDQRFAFSVSREEQEVAAALYSTLRGVNVSG